MKKIPEWYAAGLCQGYPVKMFYLYDTKKDKPAKAICAGCPSREACLQYALDNHETGVWGGTNDLDRARIVRKSYVQAALQESSRRNKRREQERPASESPVSLAHISFPPAPIPRSSKTRSGSSSTR